MNEPVLIVRPDDGPIGPKHVALNVVLMIIIDVLDGNVNTLFIEENAKDLTLRRLMSYIYIYIYIWSTHS